VSVGPDRIYVEWLEALEEVVEEHDLVGRVWGVAEYLDAAVLALLGVGVCQYAVEADLVAVALFDEFAF